MLSGLLAVAACSDDDSGGAATASPDTTGAAAVAQAVETTAPSVDTTARAGRHCRSVGFDDPGAESGRSCFEGDDFYAVPEPLPAGEPGTLLRYEPIEHVRRVVELR